jgi:3-hydroxyisobutyrate dehydrogenase
MSRVALIGAGRMGLPMCGNLVSAGHTVTATDLRPEVAGAVTAAGAAWAPTAHEAVAGAEVVLTVLPGAPEVRDLMPGLLPALRGATWVDMTSNSPQVAAPLRELARDVAVLEAPMGGGIEAARDGTLRLFVGGDAEVLAGVRPVLAAVADRITLVGGHGAGYTAKLLVNLLWFGQAVATAEALLLGRRAGLDLGLLHQVLSESPAGSEFLRRDVPSLFEGDYLRSFGLDRCCEELDAVAELARAHDLPFALSELVGEIHRRALTHYGPVDGELQAVALLEEEARTLLRPLS